MKKTNRGMTRKMSRAYSLMTSRRPVKLVMGLVAGAVVLLGMGLYFGPAQWQGDSQNTVQQQRLERNELTGALTSGVPLSRASQALVLPDYVEDPEEWTYDEQSRSFYGILSPDSQVSK